MANKKFNVTQHINLNGAKKTVSFSLNMEEAELTAFCALLEGGYTVTEQNESLSSMAGADNVVTDYKRSGRISLSGKTAEGHYVNASIKPFTGTIYFKQTVSSQDIQTVFATAHPFPLAPTTKPSTVSSNLIEDIMEA